MSWSIRFIAASAAAVSARLVEEREANDFFPQAAADLIDAAVAGFPPSLDSPVIFVEGSGHGHADELVATILVRRHVVVPD